MNLSSFIPPLSAEANVSLAPGIVAGTKPTTSFMIALATPILGYLEARGILLGLEVQEALRDINGLMIWFVLSVMSAFASWVLLTTSMVIVLTAYLGWPLMKATLIVGSIHFLIALSAMLMMWYRFSNTCWFADSINELQKDRAWLKTETNRR